MELKVGNSCGSCLNSNKPKKPREHAAHYEVAKTERWCFLHNCHVTRECTCEDYKGINSSAKSSFTRITGFNKRVEIIRLIVSKIEDKKIYVDDKIFFAKNNWLYYSYKTNHFHADDEQQVWTKNSSADRYLTSILEQLPK